MAISDIPLPKIVPDVGPGGPIADVYNALNNQALFQRKQALENQFYAPKAQADIASANALNQQRMIQNQYLPDQLRLANQMSQQQNQFYAPNIQSEIEQRKASIQRSQQMTPLEVEKLRLQNQFYPQLTEAQIQAQKAMANLRSMGGAGGMGVGDKAELAFQKYVSQDNPQLKNDPAKIYEASNVLRQGGTQLSDGTSLNPMSPASQSSLDRVIKSGNTAQGLNQQRFANTLETLFKKADKNADDAFKFAGVAGKLKGGIQALKSQRGDNDPAYTAYQLFVNEDVPAMVTEILRTSGANSTDSQKAMALRAALPITMLDNPKLAKAQYEELKNLYRGIAKTISSGLGRTSIDLRNLQDKQDSNSINPQDRKIVNGKEYHRIQGQWFPWENS